MKVKNALAIFVSIIVALSVLEIGIRTLAPRSYWSFRDFANNWQPDPILGWVQKPNLDFSRRSDYGWFVHFQTNEEGLVPHTAKRTRTAETKRLMIFGDSTVTGSSVPQDKTVTAYLNEVLEKQGIDAEVINCGVDGYSTDQVLLRMEQLIPLYRPNLAFYCLCDNDFAGNILTDFCGWPKPIYKLLPNGSLEYYPPDLTKRTTRVPGPLRLIQYSALYRFLQPTIFEIRAKLGNWGSRNLLGSVLEMFYSSEETDPIDWKLFRALLNRMKQTCVQNGAQFLLYTHPSLSAVWEPFIRDIEKVKGLKPGQYNRQALENRLQHIAAEENIAFIPLVPYFLSRQSEGPFHLLPRDPHCNPTGYRLTAEVLASHCLPILSGGAVQKNRRIEN